MLSRTEIDLRYNPGDQRFVFSYYPSPDTKDYIANTFEMDLTDLFGDVELFLNARDPNVKLEKLAEESYLAKLSPSGSFYSFMEWIKRDFAAIEELITLWKEERSSPQRRDESRTSRKE